MDTLDMLILLHKSSAKIYSQVYKPCRQISDKPPMQVKQMLMCETHSETSFVLCSELSEEPCIVWVVSWHSESFWEYLNIKICNQKIGSTLMVWSFPHLEIGRKTVRCILDSNTLILKCSVSDKRLIKSVIIGGRSKSNGLRLKPHRKCYLFLQDHCFYCCYSSYKIWGVFSTNWCHPLLL